MMAMLTFSGSGRSGKWKGKESMVEENTFEYAMVCDMTSHDAIERLRRLKEVEATKASPYNIMCRSLHDIDTYTTRLPRGNSDGLCDYIRAVKHCLPGPLRHHDAIMLS
ncbi:DHBP synthase RibB-like alpha/beta domain-containing protein [Tanacetum coccineum]